ncbi:universal stress protein [Nonomuraea sp. M3C6]|uniref:Universal stress protein n=1 Tax=Nonomuraea marmarensis TaxID=3351344 RepID=A0ABW7AKX3_9ACTN
MTETRGTTKRPAQQKQHQGHDRHGVDEDVRRAHPVAALADPSEKADLIVVASQHRGAIGAVILGSISLGVLRHAGNRVAVVRS